MTPTKKTWNKDGSMSIESNPDPVKKKAGRKPVDVHECLKEEKFTRIFEILSDINTEIFGKDGVIRTVPRLEGKINLLCEKVEAQTKVVTNLVEFQAGTTAVGKYKEGLKLSTR